MTFVVNLDSGVAIHICALEPDTICVIWEAAKRESMKKKGRRGIPRLPIQCLVNHLTPL